jgi:hypothetical protein
MRRSGLEVVEGYYTAVLLRHFHQIGLLDALRRPRPARTIAKRFGIDGQSLGPLLEFLARTTDVVERSGARDFVLSAKYQHYRALGFHFDKLLVGYAATLSSLDVVLRRPEQAGRFVDRRALANAFTRADAPLPLEVEAIVRAWGGRTLLEAGCGLAPALRTMCARDAAFTGWAVDSSADMCRAARDQIRREGLRDRIRVIQCDIRGLRRATIKRDRAKVEAIFAQSLLNEFCRGDGEEGVRVLRMLRDLFPGRPLFVVDYLAELREEDRSGQLHMAGVLQDIAQILSGQGIPPSTHSAWANVYARAGCEILNAYEGTSKDIRWFVHTVAL